VDADSPAEETKEAKTVALQVTGRHAGYLLIVAQMLEEMFSSRSSFQGSIWFVGYMVMKSNGGTSNWY